MTGGSSQKFDFGTFLQDYAGKDIMDINLTELEDSGEITSLKTFIEFVNDSYNIIRSWDLRSKEGNIMDDFLFFQAFYLRIFNNPKTFLESKILERDDKRLSFYKTMVLLIFCR